MQTSSSSQMRPSATEIKEARAQSRVRFVFDIRRVLLDLDVCIRLQPDAENVALWLEIVSDMPEMCEVVTSCHNHRHTIPKTRGSMTLTDKSYRLLQLPPMASHLNI